VDIGKRLRELREAKTLSQRDVEDRTGLPHAYISLVEMGIRPQCSRCWRDRSMPWMWSYTNFFSLGTTSRKPLNYGEGFLSGGGYDGIPLKVYAYALDRRLEEDPRQRFSVSDEVARWVREERF
jgi:hypothetical protein